MEFDLTQYSFNNGPWWIRQSQRGQIAVEYILLLILSVSLAFLLVSQLVGSTDSEEGGILIQAWRSMTRAIAQDYADAPPPP